MKVYQLFKYLNSKISYEIVCEFLNIAIKFFEG